jgi:hypothetical protein
MSARSLSSPRTPQERWARAAAHLREIQRLKKIQNQVLVSQYTAGEARSRMINEALALADLLDEMDRVGLLDALPDYLDVVYR